MTLKVSNSRTVDEPDEYSSSTMHEVPSKKMAVPVIVHTELCPGLTVEGLQVPRVREPPVVHVADFKVRLLAVALPTFLTVKRSVVSSA